MFLQVSFCSLDAEKVDRRVSPFLIVVCFGFSRCILFIHYPSGYSVDLSPFSMLLVELQRISSDDAFIIGALETVELAENCRGATRTQGHGYRL